MIPQWQAEPPRPGRHAQSDEVGPADPVDELVVRPFMVTGGRTQPLQDGLRIESMVSALPAALSAPLRFELRRIVELCQRPCSVAEIAVGLGVPLGVARVLIADLLTSGLVYADKQSELSIDIIERIRDRVRAL
jgi:Protein of unknown function (DUF742)